MLPIHSCKTKTHPECRMERTQKVNTWIQNCRSYSLEQAYEQLLQSPSFVQYERSEENFAIPLKRNVFGLYMVPIQIQGTTYQFILDTGAQISSIRDPLIQSLQLPKLKGTINIGSAGGTQKPLSGYLLDAMDIGALRIRNLPVIGLDKQDFSMRWKGFDMFSFDGILGWDILSTLDFEIDDVDKQFKILKNRFRFSYQNMIKTLFPIFLVKDASGRELIMGFDSGAKRSWMSEKSANEFAYTMSENYTMMGFGVHGLEELQVKLVKQVDFYLFKAHIKIKNMHTGRTNIFPNMEFNGILGNEIFQNRRIRIINSKQMVLLA